MGTYICTHSSLREEHFGDRFAFECNGCKEMGYGSCYTCTDACNFHLHKACQNAPYTMSHPYFKQGQFVLDKNNIISPPNNSQGSLFTNLCAACGTSVRGWRYVLATSNNSGYNYTILFHPCCMQIPHATLHPVLENVDCVHCQSMARVGNVNNEGVKGWWVYVNRGGVAVHVKCMKDMLHKEWESRYYDSNSYNQGHEGYTNGTRARGIGCPPNQGGGRRRKRDYFMSGLNGLVQVLDILDTIGLVDMDSIMEKLVEFAGHFW